MIVFPEKKEMKISKMKLCHSFGCLSHTSHQKRGSFIGWMKIRLDIWFHHFIRTSGWVSFFHILRLTLVEQKIIWIARTSKFDGKWQWVFFFSIRWILIGNHKQKKVLLWLVFLLKMKFGEMLFYNKLMLNWILSWSIHTFLSFFLNNKYFQNILVDHP